MTTSQPFMASTRAVASFARAKARLAMQPANNATRYLRGPTGSIVTPNRSVKNGFSIRGASRATFPRRGKMIRAIGHASRSIPERW